MFKNRKDWSHSIQKRSFSTSSSSSITAADSCDSGITAGTYNLTATMTNFASAAASPPISLANSFIFTLTGDSDGLKPSMSLSGFQITNLSQVLSVGRPPLSTASLKRKCSSMDDAATKCGLVDAIALRKGNQG